LRTWLKELRFKKGLTQLQVSKIVGIKRPYYTMIETGVRNPSVDVAIKIAHTLEFDWTIFFTHYSNEVKHLSGGKTI